MVTWDRIFPTQPKGYIPTIETLLYDTATIIWMCVEAVKLLKYIVFIEYKLFT